MILGLPGRWEAARARRRDPLEAAWRLVAVVLERAGDGGRPAPGGPEGGGAAAEPGPPGPMNR